MVNVFQLNYEARLQNWHDLRVNVQNLDNLNKCIKIDEWWQHAPLVNHQLHLYDIEQWPGPWDLLAENMYCTIARALGMCYTLLLVGIEDIKMVEATDEQGNDVVLVLVDNAKYVLNYWPNTIVNNSLANFTVKRDIDITNIKNKI